MWLFLNLGCSASDDIPHSDEIRAIVKDIWDLRVAKLRKSINEMVAEQETHALVGLCVGE